jgi:pyruvate/2-oxoglutarate dehydrogenase complex dihydrolipoamide dehydrogenase (E3) component
VGAAEVIDWNERMGNKGITESNPIKIRWPDLMRFKRSFTEPVPKEREEQFSKAGIVAFHGRARFVARTTVKVDDADTLTGRHIVIAAGAQPMKMNIPGEENIVKSDQFMELNELPSKVAFVGGGYISFEFAHSLIDDLDLVAAGVERENKKGVRVNEYLQSVSNPAVYAAGDAAASVGLPLTPVATYEGEIVATNLLEGNHINPNYNGIPSVVFTIPPLASVGLQEEAARKHGLHFKIRSANKADTSNWYSSRRVGEKYSGYKVLIEENTDRILGAHMLGHHAEEVIPS